MPAARVRVVEPNGTVVAVRSGELGVSGAQVPAAGGTLELAEPAGGWHATLNGQPLTPVASPAGSWAPAFRLPAGGGVLDISRDQTGRDLILIFELLAVAVVAVLALPGSRGTAEESAPGGVGSRARSGRAKGASEGGLGGRRGLRYRPWSAAPRSPRQRPSPKSPESLACRAGRRSHGRVATRGGRAGPRRDRDAAPRQRRGRRRRPRSLPAGRPAGRRPRFRARCRPGGSRRRPARGQGRHAGERRGQKPSRGSRCGLGAGRGPQRRLGGRRAGRRGLGGGRARRCGLGRTSTPVPAGRPMSLPTSSGPPVRRPGRARAGRKISKRAGPRMTWRARALGGPPARLRAGRKVGVLAGRGSAWRARMLAGSRRTRPGGQRMSAASPQAVCRRSRRRGPRRGRGRRPDQADRWNNDRGWSAQDPSGWPGGRSDVLDPLPPSRGSRHRRPEPDDDEGTPGWPIPERDWRGDAR